MQRVRDLVRNAETIYTDGTYSVSGTLVQRIAGTATVTAAASQGRQRPVRSTLHRPIWYGGLRSDI